MCRVPESIDTPFCWKALPDANVTKRPSARSIATQFFDHTGGRHIEVEDLPTEVGQNHENIKDLEIKSRHGQEIH